MTLEYSKSDLLVVIALFLFDYFLLWLTWSIASFFIIELTQPGNSMTPIIFWKFAFFLMFIMPTPGLGLFFWKRRLIKTALVFLIIPILIPFVVIAVSWLTAFFLGVE